MFPSQWTIYQEGVLHSPMLGEKRDRLRFIQITCGAHCHHASMSWKQSWNKGAASHIVTLGGAKRWKSIYCNYPQHVSMSAFPLTTLLPALHNYGNHNNIWLFLRHLNMIQSIYAVLKISSHRQQFGLNVHNLYPIVYTKSHKVYTSQSPRASIKQTAVVRGAADLTRLVQLCSYKAMHPLTNHTCYNHLR